MFFLPTFDHSGMNDQQRNRALSECIRERCERTAHNLKAAYWLDVVFTSNPLFYNKALALMKEAAEEHENVLADPEPITSFDAFGDNALALTLRAYLASTDFRIKTTTDLNKAINQKFADAGIAISFPQRDVHLDATGPLEVRVVSEPSGSKAGKPSSAVQKESDG